MNFTVVNKSLSVKQINITGVSASSVFIVGDADWIVCSSLFDTPPESLIVGAPPLMPARVKSDPA